MDPSGSAILQVAGFDLVRQVVAGLSAMHKLGFVHRDIKSQNILLENVSESMDGDVIHAVICDFGLAKNSDSVVSQVSSNAEIFGFSPRYAAPEVFALARNGGQMSAAAEMKTDVYSFGIVVHEILSVTQAWGKMDIREVEMRVRAGERPADPVVGTSDKEQLLFQLMKSSMSQDPQERPLLPVVEQTFITNFPPEEKMDE